MYSFKIFKGANIAPRADAVIFGIEHELLPASSAADYEEWAIINLGIEGSDALLTVGDDRGEALMALQEAGYRDDGDGRGVLRYAALASLKSEGEALLGDIESVYADFDYPPDMEPFIYYMPGKGTDSSPEALLIRFRDFLSRERKRYRL